MILVSRNYVGLSWDDINNQIEFVKYARDGIQKKRLDYFKLLSSERSKVGMSSISELTKLVHININNPSFQELGFDISKIRVADETIFNAYVVACYRKNYTMAGRIKPYLAAVRWKKYVEDINFSYELLASDIETDVIGYILDNGVSLKELLAGQEKRKIYNEKGEIVSDYVFDDARLDTPKRFMRETILNAYTTAVQEDDTEMAMQIRPYVMQGFLDKRTPEDVMEYILENGISDEYLQEPTGKQCEPSGKLY